MRFLIELLLDKTLIETKTISFQVYNNTVYCIPWTAGEDGPAELVFSPEAARLSRSLGTTPGVFELAVLLLLVFLDDLGPGFWVGWFVVLMRLTGGRWGLSSSLLSGSSTVSSTLWPVVLKMCFLSRLRLE